MRLESETELFLHSGEERQSCAFGLYPAGRARFEAATGAGKFQPGSVLGDQQGINRHFPVLFVQMEREPSREKHLKHLGYLIAGGIPRTFGFDVETGRV